MTDGDTIYIYSKWNQSILRVKLQKYNPAGSTIQWEDGSSNTINLDKLIAVTDPYNIIMSRKRHLQDAADKALARVKLFNELLAEDERLLEGRAG